jgi:aryl-alcohol dehydrogenase-like predicted oxidoreductase
MQLSAQKLGLGTVQFGLSYGVANKIGQVTRMDAKAMLELALASSIDTLDTAIAYGESETCLGGIGTQGFNLITKLPELPNDCKEVGAWVRHEVVASLNRLGVTDVYGLLLHRPEQLIGPYGADLYKELQNLKDIGMVKKIGISIYAPSELTLLYPRYSFDLVQAPFNLVDQRFYKSGWLQRLKDNDIEVHTRSAFLQGLLLMDQEDIPDKFAHWSELWRTWHRWLAEQDISAVQACLAFPLSFSEIDRVIVGANSLSQLSEIVSAANDQREFNFPDLQCEDESLVNPANWNQP